MPALAFPGELTPTGRLPNSWSDTAPSVPRCASLRQEAYSCALMANGEFGLGMDNRPLVARLETRERLAQFCRPLGA